MSWAGRYKYPAGLYVPNASVVWEQAPFSVKVSEDAQTLLNIPSGSWGDYYTVSTDINIGDSCYFDNCVLQLTNTFGSAKINGGYFNY